MKFFGAVETGITVWQDNEGIYHESFYPQSHELSRARHVYLGGSIHNITAEEAVDLTNGGYGEYIDHGD